jgi:hypothetical protein
VPREVEPLREPLRDGRRPPPTNPPHRAHRTPVRALAASTLHSTPHAGHCSRLMLFLEKSRASRPVGRRNTPRPVLTRISARLAPDSPPKGIRVRPPPGACEIVVYPLADRLQNPSARAHHRCPDLPAASSVQAVLPSTDSPAEGTTDTALLCSERPQQAPVVESRVESCRRFRLRGVRDDINEGGTPRDSGSRVQ